MRQPMAMNKKVLFICPSRWLEYTPRYGVGVLSAVLAKDGFDVKVADYGLTKEIPAIPLLLSDFCPDVIGISILSYIQEDAKRIIKEIRRISERIPIICGGPHVSLNYEKLSGDADMDYLVIGEAEQAISDIVKNACRQKHPLIVPRPELADLNSLPPPNYKAFIGYEKMRTYPLLTSRGCPYGCSYCATSIVSSKNFRPREINLVVQELKAIKENYSKVKNVFFYDDNFAFDEKRGKDLLRKISEEKERGAFDFTFNLGNIRADSVGEELLALFKRLSVDILWLGVESADQEVFNGANKGETLEDIIKACELSKKFGMRLIMFFIIGLPGDSFEKLYTSIRFARKYKVYKAIWNVLIVHDGTMAYKWFKNNGVIKEDDCSGLNDAKKFFGFVNPNAWTLEFSKEDRLNAWMLADIITAEASFLPNAFLFYNLAKKYKVPGDVILTGFIFRINKWIAAGKLMAQLFFSSPGLFFIKLYTIFMFSKRKNKRWSI